MRSIAVTLLAAFTVACSGAPPATTQPIGSPPASCSPTPQDVPANYVANAPERTKIGAGGYRFAGTVRSANGCSPIGDARVELWLANPSGAYDSEHRATLVADRSGRYTVDTSFPAAYGGGGSHIHIRVTATGHRALVSVFFPATATTSGEMDLVLEAN